MSSRSPQPSEPPRSRGGDAPPPSSSASWVVIGEVVGVFGVHGEIKVRPLTDFPERFERTRTIYLGEQHTPRAVERAHQHKNMVLLKLAGVTNPAAAEALRGTALAVPAAELQPLEADRFYVHDVIGLRAQHVNGQPLGTITDVLPGAGHDLFVVHDTRGEADVLVPAVKAFIKLVDVAAGVVLIDPIPGLFDDKYDEIR
ncbi:MAG TPA: ribosome maturation factor RimM [Ktedonobacterales bacterium]|nr:ribosome maturation factor RimM [Ktedonobacterales bacterium]